MSDSVSLFGEGTFEEQVRELVDYIARGLAEEPRIAFIKPFSEGLITESHIKGFDESPERRRRVITMVLAEVKSLGQGSERETEGFFNLLFAHVLSLWPGAHATRERIAPLLAVISSSTTESPVVRYRILSNLFNALPRTSSLRFDAYNVLLSIATTHKDIDVLQISKPSVDTWLSEWDVSADQKSTFLKSIGVAFLAAGRPEEAYPFLLARAESLPASASADESKAAALNLIVTALRLPLSFDLSQLLKLQVVHTHLANHPIFALLTILSKDDLGAWVSWRKANESALTEFSLNAAEIDRKLRFLTLTSLAAKHIGEDLPYADIASALQLDAGSVEVWVIDAIRAKILAGKLSQPTQTFHVTRATTTSYHSFNEKAQWEALERKLVAWRSGLVGVLGVVAGAREQAFGGAGAGAGEKETKEKEKPIVHGDLAPAAGVAA